MENGRIAKQVLLLLRSNPSRQHSKVLYRWEGQEKRKDRKIQKSRSKEKVGFSSASLFPPSNGRQSPKVEPFKQGDRPPDA